MNNSDERDYAEEAANRRMMDEENESEYQGLQNWTIWKVLHEPELEDNQFKVDYCPVCGRIMSTHIFCEGPDAS
jgi:hypothetical protein